MSERQNRGAASWMVVMAAGAGPVVAAAAILVPLLNGHPELMPRLPTPQYTTGKNKELALSPLTSHLAPYPLVQPVSPVSEYSVKKASYLFPISQM